MTSSKKQLKTSDFVGRWRITSMEMWDEDYIDMEVKAFIDIAKGRTGEFQFGLVSGFIDCHLAEGPRGKRLEFTWEGMDEMDECSGSGWVELSSPSLLDGHIKFHGGDASDFQARRTKSSPG
jgi:hypothetical protein